MHYYKYSTVYYALEDRLYFTLLSEQYNIWTVKTRSRQKREQLRQAGLPTAVQSHQERMTVIRGAASVWGLEEDLRCRRETTWVTADDRWRLKRVGFIWEVQYRPWAISHHQPGVHNFYKLQIVAGPWHRTRDDAVTYAVQQTDLSDSLVVV